MRLNLIVIYCFLAIYASSQTYVSGVINSNTTWTSSNSPYVIGSNTVLYPNVKLTIEPGVLIQIYPEVEFRIRGEIEALGTSSDSIRFIGTSTSIPARWSSIFIDNSTYNPKLNFNYVVGQNASSFIHVSSSNGNNDTLLKLRNSRFSNNGVVIGHNDYTKGHYVYIDSCNFINNSYYISLGASNYIIKNSNFQNNYGGLYNSTSQNTIIDNCVFKNNGNLTVAISKGIIINSLFQNNNIAITNVHNNSPLIKYNTITNNSVGIEVIEYLGPNTVNNVIYNKICSNTINMKKQYSADFYAPYNCWCYSDSAQVSGKIIDFFDQSDLGIIHFVPFDTDCSYSGQYMSVDFVPENQNKIILYPNPVNDVLIVSTQNIRLNTIRIFDNQGKQMHSSTCQGSLDEGISIDTQSLNLQPGVYIIELVPNAGETIIKRFIKI